MWPLESTEGIGMSYTTTSEETFKSVSHYPSASLHGVEESFLVPKKMAFSQTCCDAPKGALSGASAWRLQDTEVTGMSSDLLSK